jgi:hypothetical protein
MNEPEQSYSQPDCQAEDITADIDERDLAELAKYDPEVLRAIFAVVIAPHLGNQTTVQTITCRAVALAHVLHVPGIGDKSLTALAARIGVGKALLSSYCVKLRDFAKLDSRAGRTITARRRMAEARRESHAGRNNKRNST